ncbi:hypothetical protein [Ktedonobacter robiniae]|uniref:Uncharacterized protein n=1 Tax=Ktedonobacter robiniae TaxID=2778365 RepID=A0ABQ3ULX7_9CHLR|nr:hypothetical protein [Ktedonobacter robiniae]GHO53749.1 hypothetical protein KSB_22240 [Ktedonobacter robiniae]
MRVDLSAVDRPFIHAGSESIHAKTTCNSAFFPALFAIEHPDVKAGFQAGQQAIYRDTRPESDMEVVRFISDFMADEPRRLAYNVGFWFGLYANKHSTLRTKAGGASAPFLLLSYTAIPSSPASSVVARIKY